LVAIKCLDPIFLEQNSAIDISSKHNCVWKKLPPPAKRCPRHAKLSHVRRKTYIVCAQSELKDPQRLVVALLEERRIHRGVVVRATFIASVLSHDATNLCRSPHVYALKSLRKIHRSTSAETTDFWCTFEEPGGNQTREIGRKTPPTKSNAL